MKERKLPLGGTLFEGLGLATVSICPAIHTTACTLLHRGARASQARCIMHQTACIAGRCERSRARTHLSKTTHSKTADKLT